MVEYKGNLPSILKVAFFGVVSLSFIKVNTENEGKVNLPWATTSIASLSIAEYEPDSITRPGQSLIAGFR